jgi:hypothetical protein
LITISSNCPVKSVVDKPSAKRFLDAKWFLFLFPHKSRMDILQKTSREILSLWFF